MIYCGYTVDQNNTQSSTLSEPDTEEIESCDLLREVPGKQFLLRKYIFKIFHYNSSKKKLLSTEHFITIKY